MRSKNRISLFVLKQIIFLTLLAVWLFSGCQKQSSAEPTQTLPVPTESGTPFSVLLSPCNLIDQQYFYDVFAEGTLFFQFNDGMCRVSNQWETRMIEFSVTQGGQADEAIRWYTKKIIKGWSSPELIAQLDDVLNEGAGQNLADLQETVSSIYTTLDFRKERVFSVGDTSYWYTFPRAQASILDSSENDRYLRIAVNGFFSEEALDISLELAEKIYSQLPERFSINFNYDSLELINYATPTALVSMEAPSVLSVTADREEIFFGDLCANESTNILVEIDKTELLDTVYLVYRLTSPGEVNDNWVTKRMNRVTDGVWQMSLSAEGDFSGYKVVNGAALEYSISVIYGVNGVLSTPNYSDVRVYQCVQSN
jgi:hypothetical protein